MQYIQFDVTTAFLNGDVKKELYLQAPDKVKVESGQTLRLKRTFYGLSQSPRCWNVEFSSMLKQFNMTQTYAEPCIYVGKEP